MLELPACLTSIDLKEPPLNLRWLRSRSTQQLGGEDALADQSFLLYSLYLATASFSTLVSPSEKGGCNNSSSPLTLTTHV